MTAATKTSRGCAHDGGTYRSDVRDGRGFPGTRCAKCDRLLKIEPINEWK